MIFDAELTDTFSGEANYCWVRRASFVAPANASPQMLLRRARKALRVNYSFRTVWENGDMLRADDRKALVCLFISSSFEG